MMIWVLVGLFMSISGCVTASEAATDVGSSLYACAGVAREVGLPTKLDGFDNRSKFEMQVEGVMTYEVKNRYWGQFRIMLAGKLISYRATDGAAWTRIAAIDTDNNIIWNNFKVLNTIPDHILMVMMREAGTVS
jgi:hypothetical protein